MCTSCGCDEITQRFNESNSGRIISVDEPILARNDATAAKLRRQLSSEGILSFNLLSSPGSGKTQFLVKTCEALRDQVEITVIEGDQQTDNDAQRIRQTGIPAYQINTGKACHLEADRIVTAVAHLSPQPNSLLFIENVGNLVCPAAFDLGEFAKIVIFSITEGEDKPLKYPDMFNVANIIIINKCDLLPYLDFDMDRCQMYIQRVNPNALVLQVSAKTGQGMSTWTNYLMSLHQKQSTASLGLS